MDRRGFLKGLASVPAIPFIQNPVISAINGLLETTLPQVPVFLSTEAAVEILATGHPITTGNFSKVLWPGVNKWFAEAYDNYPDLPEVFK